MHKEWHINYELGKKAFEEKKYEAARIHLENVLSEKTTFADVYNMLGFIYYLKGKYTESVDYFKQALKINPHYTEAALNLSVAYNELGDIDKAKDVYFDAKKVENVGPLFLDPYVEGKLANMHADIGAIYSDLGLYAEAADEYKKAATLRPSFADIRTKLGSAYRDMKDFQKAIDEITEAVKLNDKYLPARIQLGLTYYIMGEHDRARQEWQKALGINPDDRVAQMYLSMVGGKGK
ncbi:MAG: tetratricopeptide repeat protein [Deltaproteobacteria bacterium]|nr:tetratricopeptide repeat protein [Deltaproteobacteria bacterium]